MDYYNFSKLFPKSSSPLDQSKIKDLQKKNKMEKNNYKLMIKGQQHSFQLSIQNMRSLSLSLSHSFQM